MCTCHSAAVPVEIASWDLNPTVDVLGPRQLLDGAIGFSRLPVLQARLRPGPMLPGTALIQSAA